jgi:hypothetical protein
MGCLRYYPENRRAIDLRFGDLLLQTGFQIGYFPLDLYFSRGLYHSG